VARTVLPKSNRYNVRGNTEVLWIPRAAAGVSAGPVTLTAAMLIAATTVELTNDVIPPINGFTSDTADVPVPDLGSLRTFNIEGETTIAASSMDFYLSSTVPVDDVRSVLHNGDEGYLVIADNGLAVGAPVDVAEVTCKFPAKARGDVARVTVPFSIAGIQENVPVPA
jgi:hypothetical protein